MAARRRVDGVFCVVVLEFRNGEPRITERTDASSRGSDRDPLR